MESNADHDEGAGDIHVDDSGSEGMNQEPNATAKVFFELLKEAKKKKSCTQVARMPQSYLSL
jgi:hypothetical protein